MAECLSSILTQMCKSPPPPPPLLCSYVLYVHSATCLCPIVFFLYFFIDKVQWIIVCQGSLRQTCTFNSKFIMFPNLREGDILIWCGSVDIGVWVGVTLSCLHNILWISDWILTKFSWIYNLDITKNWLDFADLDLIVKVTAVEKMKILG